ncbi:hypothetical protein BDN71DRAFT_609575 [Pleurotus eryngii]|uniref:Uncharacterized protein n=1 Tax=Pleurotus eryngii TaxID=5323 RepID=A0A9P6A376_PLEER|nr:hypothetical protein BDN71DRAFT_609575 [Pleurotus eryngii]
MHVLLPYSTFAQYYYSASHLSIDLDGFVILKHRIRVVKPTFMNYGRSCQACIASSHQTGTDIMQRKYHKVRRRSPGRFVSAAGPKEANRHQKDVFMETTLATPLHVLTVVIFMEIESGCRNVDAGSWVFSRRSSLRYRRKALLSTAHHLGNASYSRVISPGSGVAQTRCWQSRVVCIHKVKSPQNQTDGRAECYSSRRDI